MNQVSERIENYLNERKKLNWKIVKRRMKKFKKPKVKKKGKETTNPKLFVKLRKKGANLFKKLFKGMRLSEMLNESEEAKIQALISYLDDVEGEEVEADDIDVNSWGSFDTEYGEYLVLDDQEADQAAKEYIEDSIWAFNSWFILDHITIEDLNRYFGFEDTFYDEDEDEDIEIDDPDEVFYLNTGMYLEEWVENQQQRAESGNDELYRAIDDIDAFVEDAITADGRGHFLSSYDGEEYEEGKYFIYRIN